MGFSASPNHRKANNKNVFYDTGNRQLEDVRKELNWEHELPKCERSGNSVSEAAVRLQGKLSKPFI